MTTPSGPQQRLSTDCLGNVWRYSARAGGAKSKRYKRDAKGHIVFFEHRPASFIHGRWSFVPRAVPLYDN